MPGRYRIREVFALPTSMYAKPLARRMLLGLAFFCLFLLVLSADFVTDKVSLQEGQVSDRDIIATRTISYIDNTKTKKLEMEVLSSVTNVYDMDVNVLGKTEDNVATLFQSVRRLDKVQLQQTLNISLSDPIWISVRNMDEKGIVTAQDVVLKELRKYLQRGIREDDLESVRKLVVDDIQKYGLGKDVENIAIGVTQVLIKPNFNINVRETDKRRQIALSGIEPVRETVKKGQVLVRRGDVVSAEQLQAMEALGIQKGHVNELRILGLTVFIILILTMILGCIYRFNRSVYDNDIYLLLLGLILLGTVILAKSLHYYSDFFAPLAAGALLTAILINVRLGFFASIILALFFGIIVENDLRAVVVPLVGSLVGVYSVTKMTHGYSLVRTGCIIAGVNFLVVGATGFIEQISTTQVFIEGMQGMLAGLASAVITIGVLPFFEHTFKITTPIQLLELARPNHPLLQRLLIDAPGTYHHSILVGNLAEMAAEIIGADPILVRVGAYYHDIGKIKRPYFFIENQMGEENPHDKIAPSLSTLIVTSHVKDGVELCKDYKIPQAIIDIVEQHHGTTLVSYFYKRATENEHECIIESDFRYEGPNPQTKEAALIMLADSCEAAVRSISKLNANRIEGMVRKIIRKRLYDGQLNECDLTLKDLNTIGDVFIKVLTGMFHKRIEYPELNELERRKNKNGNCSKQCTNQDSIIGDKPSNSQ